MKVNVIVFEAKTREELELPENATSYDILKKLDLRPDTLIITRNNQPIPIDEELIDNDEIKLIRVISGG